MSNDRNDDAERLAGIFGALANPNRLRIFLRLMDCCSSETRTFPDSERTSCCGGAFVRDLDLAPSTISHHIKELRRAGLILVKRCGKTIECRLDGRALAALQGFFGTGAKDDPGKKGEKGRGRKGEPCRT